MQQKKKKRICTHSSIIETDSEPSWFTKLAIKLYQVIPFHDDIVVFSFALLFVNQNKSWLGYFRFNF